VCVCVSVMLFHVDAVSWLFPSRLAPAQAQLGRTTATMTILAAPEYLLTSQLQGMSGFDIRAAGQSFAGTATLSGDHVTLRSCMWKCGCHAGSGQSDRTLAISQPSAKRRKTGLKKKEWAKGFPCCGFWRVDTGTLEQPASARRDCLQTSL
jgi:hypothetical protein